MIDQPHPAGTTPQPRAHRHLFGRLRRHSASRRAKAHARRDFKSVLAGHHGVAMRGELLAILEGR